MGAGGGKRLSPEMRPARLSLPPRRAQARQSAGTRYTPALSSTDRARPSVSSAVAISLSESRSHLIRLPATNTDPFERIGPASGDLPRDRREQAIAATWAVSRHIASGRTRRFRTSPWCRRGSRHAWPIVAACWSPAIPQIGIGAPNRLVVAIFARRKSTISGKAERGASNKSIRPSSQCPLPIAIKRGTAGVSRVGDVHAAGKLPDQPRIDRPDRELVARMPLAAANWPSPSRFSSLKNTDRAAARCAPARLVRARPP